MNIQDYKIPLIGILCGILAWFIEASLHIFLFLDEHDYIEQLIFPTTHEILLRSLIVVLIVSVSIILHFNIILRKKGKALKESEEKYQEAYNLINFYKDLFAHDMNNILQSILSSVEYHSFFRNDPEKLNNFGDISERVKMHVGMGTSLIKKVRKLSKIEETEIDMMPINVFNVLNKSVENTKNNFPMKNVNIKTEGISKDLKILGGELLIDVFDNLLNNAIKFTEDDDEAIVNIIISKIQADDINFVKFEFKDYGTGIQDDRKDILFKKLYERDKYKRGMGIGLSLVKKIMDKYEGKIWVEDRIKGKYKEGSNFVLLLKEAY